MSKEKDPAFLFYSKDWLEGTAEMTNEERGVYIQLLCHQHQKGDLPSELNRLANLAAMSLTEFLVVWETLKHKFYINENNRFANRKMTKVTTDRSEKGKRNGIIGTLASVVRLSKEPYEKKAEAKKTFNFEDFLEVEDHLLTVTITEWFNKRLKSIEDANANANANTNNIKEGVFEKKSAKPEIPLSDWDTARDSFLCQTQWFTNFCRTKKISVNQMISWQTEFIGDLELKQEYKPLKELYSHFTNWVNIKTRLNGSHRKVSDDTKLGTSSARIQAARDF